MKVFVSWSGDVSHAVASALKIWLPEIIQAVEVFLSSEDIAKGSHWFSELNKEIDDSDFGILCLTRSNLGAPWILYEAGALGKHFEQSRVVPLLIDLEAKDLEGPLEQLNAASMNKTEIGKILAAINKQLGKDKLSKTHLDKAFSRCWPSLEKALDEARKLAETSVPGFKYDVFLSTPMASYASDAEYRAGRADFKKVFDALKEKCGLSVYWASEKIESIDDFDTQDVSAQEDLDALKKSRRFVLLYPQKLPTSALFEAGYALALNCESHYFVHQRGDLPFLMREITNADGKAKIHDGADWKNYDKLAAHIARNNGKWFPK